jgi:outer membrane receptor protein involved in Fe transport
LSVVLLAMANPAFAQQAGPAIAAPELGARIAYDAAHYAQFAPRTALDMIRQTPGFSLQEGLDRRGFSGSLGNVLVDGKRPIAKSQTLSDILQRIPAAQVLRIELLRGGEAASEGLGFVVVANVVRTPSAGGGVWSLGTEYAGRAPVPNGWASWSGRVGSTDYSLGTNGYSLLRNLPGERIITSAEGELIETRIERSPRSFYEIAVNGEAGRPMFGGSVRLTGQAYYSRYHDEGAIVSFGPQSQPIGDELNPYTESDRKLEAGIEHNRIVGGWDLSLAALVTRKRYDSDVQSTSRNAYEETLLVFEQDLSRRSSETIVRATLLGQPGTGHQLEAGLEGALNRLSQDLVSTIDFGQGPFPLPIPNANLSVRETRAEAYVTHKWTLDTRWSMESRLAAEVSRLSFEGDTDDAVALAYLKPSIQIARRLGRRNEVRLRFYRDVGQLDFTDFVSSASVSDDIIHGGNPDLRPEKSWRFEGIADLRFGESSALNLKLFHYWIDNVVDLIVVGPPADLFDAPGNIGRGRVYGAEATLRFPLTQFIPGGSLSVEGSLKDASVRDPLTGRKRVISDFAESSLKTEFRQDLSKHKVAWGVTYTHKPELFFYRFNEIDRKRESPSLDLWAERSLFGGYKVRATFLSILGSPEKRQRTFFEPDRSGDLVKIERWRRDPGNWLLLSVSGNF